MMMVFNAARTLLMWIATPARSHSLIEATNAITKNVSSAIYSSVICTPKPASKRGFSLLGIISRESGISHLLDISHWGSSGGIKWKVRFSVSISRSRRCPARISLRRPWIRKWKQGSFSMRFHRNGIQQRKTPREYKSEMYRLFVRTALWINYGFKSWLTIVLRLLKSCHNLMIPEVNAGMGSIAGHKLLSYMRRS